MPAPTANTAAAAEPLLIDWGDALAIWERDELADAQEAELRHAWDTSATFAEFELRACAI